MLSIPESELQFLFSRSGGKGGQNVNKVESRVQLRWNIAASAAFSPEQKVMLTQALASRLTMEDDVIIDVDTTRSQAQNREEAVQRLTELVAKALIPRKKRRPTRSTYTSKLKRLEGKKKHSSNKRRRKTIDVGDIF